MKPKTARAIKSKASPAAKKLAQLTKEIAKARAEALHASLFGVFVLVAATGDVPRAKRILDTMYGGRTPPPTKVASALSTQAIDGFCAAADLGEVTKGLPYFGPARAQVPPIGERVRGAETMIRERVTTDAYGGVVVPETDAWRDKDPNDRATWIERWRRIQSVAREGTVAAEKDALARLDAYLGDLGEGARMIAHGDELALALDLALRHAGDALVAAWLAKHRGRVVEERFFLESAMCFPAVASAIVRGALREAIGLSPKDLDAALAELDATLDRAAEKAARATKPPKIQRRRVSCSYAQIHLEPASPTDEEKALVHFQKRRDSEEGMSLFPTTVAIATPSETDYVDAEVTVSSASTPDTSLDGVVQAVAFPLVVRAPLRLTSVDSARDEEPLVIRPGTYDVLARFFPKKAPRASAEAGLRVFKLELAFHAAGALGAPRTLLLEA